MNYLNKKPKILYFVWTEVQKTDLYYVLSILVYPGPAVGLLNSPNLWLVFWPYTLTKGQQLWP